MQRSKIHSVTTLAKVARELSGSEDLLHELIEQIDTEDGVFWVYGVEEEAVVALSHDGIDCLIDLLAEHRRLQR